MNPEADRSHATELNQGLRRRHMSLIALGGVIGAGLFVASGEVIRDTGPGAIVSFLLAGVLALLVMRMLGEMAVARPAVGSFYEYARLALGDWAGFTIGWLYWYFWVIVVAVEATAGAKVVHSWLPGIPSWAIVLTLMVVLTATNLFSVSSYGEFEFWFSSIKVAAICVFILLGGLFVAGLWPGAHPDLSNLSAHGGFAPRGIPAIFAGVVPAVAFFTGAEITTVAAAESPEPQRAVARATNSVIYRVLLFYVGSIFVVVALQPWTSKSVQDSPYVSGLERLGIAGAGTIMQALILIAVLSALNSGLYTASRILFALTTHGDAPRGLTTLSRRGVPVRAILLGTVLGFASAVMDYLSPEKVFSFLVHSYGAVALFVYLLIAISQVRLRRRLERENEQLTVKMWWFPYLSWFTIAAMALVILAMAFLDSTRADFWISILTLAVVLGAYLVRRQVGSPSEGVEPTDAVSPTETSGQA